MAEEERTQTVEDLSIEISWGYLNYFKVEGPTTRLVKRLNPREGKEHIRDGTYREKEVGELI